MMLILLWKTEIKRTTNNNYNFLKKTIVGVIFCGLNWTYLYILSHLIDVHC